jgi:hypothetical protein
LLAFYYRLDTFLLAIEEHAPVEWAGLQFLNVRKARAYEIKREIDAQGGLECWFQQKALEGISTDRICRGRETLPSQLADAFVITLADGKAGALSCARCLAGNAKVELQDADREDPHLLVGEVRDYLIHSRLLWRLAANKT